MEEWLKKFRIRLEDIPKLPNALSFPETVWLDNRCKVTGLECLCILLRRFACKRRMHELCSIFERDESVLDRFCFAEAVKHVFENFSNLFNTFSARFYTREFFQDLCQKNVEKGREFSSSFGLFDGTLAEPPRPGDPIDVQWQFPCYKKFHALKYQAVMAPNGLIL